MSKKARVFIVGLDGATFDLILPCMHGNKVKASSTRIYTLALSARIKRSFVSFSFQKLRLVSLLLIALFFGHENEDNQCAVQGLPLKVQTVVVIT